MSPRAPCDHPDFTSNVLRGGFVQRFLSKANSDGIALQLSNTALQFGSADYSLVDSPFLFETITDKAALEHKARQELINARGVACGIAGRLARYGSVRQRRMWRIKMRASTTPITSHANSKILPIFNQYLTIPLRLSPQVCLSLKPCLEFFGRPSRLIRRQRKSNQGGSAHRLLSQVKESIMEADLPIIAPTHYDLSGRNIHISYSTTGVDGQPHFTYQDLQQTRSFSGDQIRRVETEVATIVSVTFAPSVDFGGHTFSVLIPRVNLPAGPGARENVQTYGITTLHRFAIPPLPTTGQRDFYTITRLNGTASQVVF